MGGKMKKYNIAVVGATGLVGTTLLKLLKEQKININKLYCYASSSSAGKEIKYNSRKIIVEELSEENIKNKKIDYALFSAGASVSKLFVPIFVKYGATVIDNSSAFRQDKIVPLIVPEVNYKKTNSKIIANPNCSTIQCMPLLNALNKEYKLKKVDYTTFQAVSGSGQKGIDDLERTSRGEKSKFYPYPIKDNCLPHIGKFLDNGYSEEEIKMLNESRKILNLPTLKVSATCVRVPIKNCHSIAITAQFQKKIDILKVRDIFQNLKGVVLLDDLKNNIYPLASVANNSDKIFVGRIRLDLFDNKKLHLFCVADNIRVGAATNAVRILKKLINEN